MASITHPLFKLFARPVGNRPDCRTAYLRGAVAAHYDGAEVRLNMQELSHGIEVLEEALAERPRGLHLIQLWRRCICHIEEIDLNAVWVPIEIKIGDASGVQVMLIALCNHGVFTSPAPLSLWATGCNRPSPAPGQKDQALPTFGNASREFVFRTPHKKRVARDAGQSNSYRP